MKLIKLGELVNFIGGGTPSKSNKSYWGGDIPWASVKDFGDKHTLSQTQLTITQDGVNNSSAKIIPQGYVVIPTRMALGKAAITDRDIAINQDLKAVVPISETDTHFLKWFFISSSELINRLGSGATVKGITIEKLKKLEFPLFPLEEQKRIAAILDDVDESIRLRKDSIKALDDLIQSTFISMFGDPVSNPMGWEIETLINLIENGPQNGLYKPGKLYGSGNRILRIDGFYNGMLTGEQNLKRVTVSDKEVTTYGLKTGDIVINRVNSKVYLGKCALIPKLSEPVVFESNMMRFSVTKSRADGRFLVEMLQSQRVKSQILTSAKDAVNQSSINQKDVSSFTFPLPPLEEQKEFALAVQAIEDQKLVYKDQLTELEGYFECLQQKAFKGKL